MKNNHKDKIELLDYIDKFIKIIVGVMTIATGLGYTISKNKFFLFLAILSIVLFVVFFFSSTIITNKILVFVLNKTVPKSNIKILDKVVTYEFIDRYKSKFASSFSIKVIGDVPINCHEEMLKWTGGFIPEVTPLKSNQTISFNKDPLCYNQMEKQKFQINFPNGKKINKNDEPYKTGFKILGLEDKEKKAKPMLVVGIYNITKRLKLKVCFPSELNPEEIRGLKYAHFIDEHSYETCPLKLQYDDVNNKHYVEFDIKDPIYGGKYAIDWNFNG